MINPVNKKGWPCVLYKRMQLEDGTLRESFRYRNPENPNELEIEIFDLKPVPMEQVSINISLDDERQLKLPETGETK